jgi:hypothetical protein
MAEVDSEPRALLPKMSRQELENLRTTNPEFPRWARFAIQAIADTFSLAEQVPLRVLILERLEDLPRQLHKLLQVNHVQALLANLIGPDEDGVGWRRLPRLSVAEIEERLLQVDRVMKACWVQEDLASLGNEITHGMYSQAMDDDFVEVLRILRPHIEAEIWLTEPSNAQPIHALWRLHDLWPIYLLGWCYRKRETLREHSEALMRDLASEDPPTIELFDGVPFKAAVLPPLRITDGSVGLLLPLIGPFTPEPMVKSVRNSLVDRFLNFAYFSRQSSPKLLAHREFASSKEELLDATYLVEALPNSELSHRWNTLALAWDAIQRVKWMQDYSQLPDRAELERISTLTVWLARLQHGAGCEGGETQAIVSDLVAEGLHLAFVNSRYVVQVNNTGRGPWEIELVRIKGAPAKAATNAVEQTRARVDGFRSKHHWLMSPGSLLHTVRQRRTSAWTDHIFAVNGLLNRQLASTQIKPANRVHRPAGNETLGHAVQARFEDASWILMGFGGRLCQTLVSMTRADTVTVYWLDYSVSPPRLRHVSGHSRHYVHRAHRDNVVRDFDAETWLADVRDPEVGSRHRDLSLVYRVARTGRDEFVDPTHGDALWSGYPDTFKPSSALAVPILYGGRVIGVVGCNGIAMGQLSRDLFAPLRKVAQLLGPFMHSTLLLRSISELVHIVDVTPPILWRQVRTPNGCPVDTLARVLSNVLLIPDAQVWLAQSDKNNFKLLANSNARLFEPGVTKDTFTVSNAVHGVTTRGIGDLAILQWRASIQRRRNGHAAASSTAANDATEIAANVPDSGALGEFLQALYVPGPSITNLPSPQEVAPGSTIEIHDDFIGTKGSREHIFKKLGRDQMLAFALPFHESVGALSDMAAERAHAIGVVLAFDGEGAAASHLTKPGERGVLRQIYGLEWQPVIQYMQEIIPAVLQQAQLITTLQAKSHALVIHEAAKALDELVNQSEKLLQQLHFVVQGKGRDFLRALAQIPPVGVDAALAKSVWNAVRNASNTLQELSSERAHNNLRRVASRLKGNTSYAYLELDPAEMPIEIDIGEDLSRRMRELLPMSGSLLSTYIEIRRNYSIEVEESLWNHLVSNILTNMAKYAETDTYSIKLQKEHLIFSNYAPYDAERDHPADRHLQFGVRGSASPNKRGDGYGLYIARDSAQLLGIPFTYSIRVTSEKRAEYIIDLDLRAVLIRRPTA